MALNYNPALQGENATRQTIAALDLGAGIALINKKNNKKFAASNEPSNTLGFSVAHVNKPSYSFNKSSKERLLMRLIYMNPLTIVLMAAPTLFHRRS